MSSAMPRVRAVTRPTRRPVNGPGPTPTATAVMSWRATHVSSSSAVIPGASSSPCRRASTVVEEATTRSPSCRATVTAGVAVSKASSTATRLRGPRRIHGRDQVDAAPPLPDGPQPQRPGLALLVAVRAQQPHLEAVVGEPLGDPGAPLHDGDGLVERGVQVQVVELGEAGPAPGVRR